MCGTTNTSYGKYFFSLDRSTFVSSTDETFFASIKSVELTKMYLSRLKKYGPKLLCVVTLTEDLAMKQAQAADDDLKRGKYRGSLHGIPWGAKDLFATKGIKTTWGSEP